MIDNKPWFVLYTKPNQEKKAREQLNNLNIENYLATVNKVKRWSDRNKNSEEIIIKSYIFIRSNEKERLMALKLSSMSRCIYDQGKPAIVPNWQIQNLKMFLLKTENVFVSNEILDGKRVLIKEGPFAGVIGTIQKSLNQNCLAVSLDFLNRSVTTIISEEAIKIIELFSEELDEKRNISDKLSEKFLAI